MDNKLDKWRKQINSVDQKLLILLAKRLSLARKIGQHKKKRNLPILDQQRWNKILESNLNQAKSLNLSEIFIKRMFNLLHQYSLRVQKEVGNYDKKR
ncbi:chorismate mutase [Candidatus Daviesbacteria bacterium]|nr:chorismate mutase [Candidatus Daviesbacteria bacterium]